MRARAPSGLLAVIALFAACAPKQPTDTLGETLERAARAMSEGDGAALHGMLDERQLVGLSVEDLDGRLDEDAAEFELLAGKVADPAKIEITATIEAEDGPPVVFVLEEDGWKLDTSFLTTDSPSDPLEALARLASELRALRLRLAESGLLAPHHESGFLATIEKLAAEIDAVEAEQLVLAEDRCYCNLPSGHKIELVREGDTWKLFSIFPPIEFR